MTSDNESLLDTRLVSPEPRAPIWGRAALSCFLGAMLVAVILGVLDRVLTPGFIEWVPLCILIAYVGGLGMNAVAFARNERRIFPLTTLALAVAFPLAGFAFLFLLFTVL